MSAATLAAMVVRKIEDWGRDLTVVKLESSGTDSNKPWNGIATQAAVDSLTVKGIFMPATSSGMGHFIDKEQLGSEVSEVVAFAPPTTGEDLTGYHQITDGSSNKRIDKWWVMKPADVVIAYVASIRK